MSQDNNKSDVVTISLSDFAMPVAVIVASIILSIAIIIASYNLKGGISVSRGDTVLGDTDVAPAAAQDDFPEANTTIDDDPFLGDKDNAKVAIVEFSDYECPFCKRHYEQTQSQLIDNYVNTGDAILVFRDFPLSFHDPLATKQAIAAECVQDIAGNQKYFEYHDLIFETTESNGNGMDEGDLVVLATQIGVNKDDFNSCYKAEKFAEEIADDISDGQAAGVTGTPGFVIGVLNDDGSVSGKLIAGAYPYDSFVEIIEEMLAR